MTVGYAILYEDGELIISKTHTVLSKTVYKDYEEFDDEYVPWKYEVSYIKTIRIYDSIKSNCMKSWFKDCENLTTLIDFQNLDISTCEDFSSLFSNCNNLMNINSLQNWNVSNGKDFSSMFAHCEQLKSIQLPITLQNIDKYIFEGCNKDLKIQWKNHVYTLEDLNTYEQF